MSTGDAWLQLLWRQGYAIEDGHATRAVGTRQRPTLQPRRCPTEDEEQAALFQWAETMQACYQETRLGWLYPNLNGGYRSKGTAGRLKALGSKAGVPDLFLPLAQHGFHGCYVELKALDGTEQTMQETWRKHLASQGYCTGVYKGWVAAAQHLCWYLGRLDLAAVLDNQPGGNYGASTHRKSQ